MKFKAIINGKEIDLQLIDNSTESVTFVANGVTYSVAFKEGDINIERSVVGGGRKPVVISNRKVREPSRGASKISANGKASVTSPIPGIVVSVNVNRGDSVQSGDTLLVLEAMKMQNNIPAPFTGIVEEVLVKAGDEVLDDTVLVVIKEGE